MMIIPARIQNIAKTAALASAAVALCFYSWNAGAGTTFIVAAGWMILNLLFLAAILRIALGTEDSKRVGRFAMALVGKFVLLGSGIFAIFAFRPYNVPQVVGMFAGISIVLFVIVMKALGAKVSQSLAQVPAADAQADTNKAKQYDGTGARA